MVSRRRLLRAALGTGGALTLQWLSQGPWRTLSAEWVRNVAASQAASEQLELVAVGQEELVLSKADRDRLGLTSWPDGLLGMLPSDEEYTFFAANSSTVARTSGSLEVPVASGVHLAIRIQAMKHEYQYAAGGPVYRDPNTGSLLLFYHAEQWPDGDPRRFYSLLGLAKSSDGGITWSDLGEIISPELPPRSEAPGATEVGGGAFVVVGEYLYVYFRDRLRSGTVVNLAVARARIDDVLVAPNNLDDAAPWTKYADGAWREPGLGGRASPLEVANPSARWFDVSYNQRLQAYLLVVSAGGPALVNLYLVQSLDGLAWSARQQLNDDAGESFYPTLVGLGPDPRISGDQFYVYYTHSNVGGFGRWSDAILARRRLSLRR